MKKLPLLEQIDIPFLRGSLEIIGKSCPCLKSLKIRHKLKSGISSSIMLDHDAFDIAKTMPKLQRLKIPLRFVTMDGVDAILKGCPLLRKLSSST